MEYRICNNCNQLVEVKKEVDCSGGQTITKTTCPNCGYVKVETRNHIHYGNDYVNK